MKKSIVLIIGGLFLFINNVFAQRNEKIQYLPTYDMETLHWGFYLGLNQKSFKLDYNYTLPSTNPLNQTRINVQAETGFNIGLIGDLRLTKNLNLRLEPGLSHNVKTLFYSNPNKIFPTPRDSVRNVSGSYLHIPLLLKFSANRINNFRPYLLAGLSYDLNIGSNQKSSEDNSQHVFRMSKNNFMYEVGFGIDFYLFYFKFSPSIRGIFALNNELVRDADPNSKWTAPINYLGTRGIFLNFAFE